MDKKKSLKQQQGLSLLGLIAVLAILGFAAVIGMKLFPLYYEKFQVNSIMDRVVADPESAIMSPSKLRQNIMSRMNINQVYGLKREYFDVRREDGKLKIQMQYEKRTNLVGDLDAVMRINRISYID